MPLGGPGYITKLYNACICFQTIYPYIGGKGSIDQHVLPYVPIRYDHIYDDHCRCEKQDHDCRHPWLACFPYVDNFSVTVVSHVARLPTEIYNGP